MFYHSYCLIFFLIFFLYDTPLIFTNSSSSLSPTSRSARRIGNVTLGGLFPVHEYGSPREPCGAISEFRGIQRLEAMLFAIEQINNDKYLLPGIELGAVILDTCSDDNYALEQSLEFVLSRLASSSCKCVNKSASDYPSSDNVFGVVGATLSSVSVHVANLLRLFQLPQISYASTTPKLSEPSYEYFARTVPSDSNQARAIVDILHRLNFTYVNTIYSHGDYGEGGFREFRRLLKISSATTDDELNFIRKKQTRICIADEQRLQRDATIQDIKQILQTMLDRIKSDVQVRVYVLFVTKEDARKLLQAIKLINSTHRPVLIASDAWGKESSVIINGETDEIAIGALTLELISIQPAGFDEYFNALKPDLNIIKYSNKKNSKQTLSRNPWFNEFWEHRFSCNLINSIKCSQYQLNETNWDSKLQFIVDAVYVFARALHYYFNCTTISCPANISLTDINGKKLFQLILEQTFIMPDLRQIQFNSERFVPGHYRIYNYRRLDQTSSSSLSDTIQFPYEYVSVGEWKIGQNQNGELNLMIDSIIWPSTNLNDISTSKTIPISRCSEPCRVGELRQFQGDSCCWVCTPCNETSIVTGLEGQERCEPCSIGYWPTQNRTSCYKLKETSIEFFSILALVPISISIIGNFLTLFVVIIFYQKRETPIIKASGKELCFIMLAGIHLCYLMTFPIIMRPSIITCIIQRLGIGLAFSMMYAALLTKTNCIARIFESTKKQGKLRPQYISPHSQVAICSCLILVQLLLSLLWIAYERPSIGLISYERLIILKCQMHKYSFLFSLIYNALLVLICTVYAVRTRKVPENFNETKFIGFTCYTTCILWLAFLPIYFTANETGRHQVHITTLCITISLCATVALACLFSPKVYIILFHPEKNMRLTKQVKAQANSLKFASQLPANPDFMLNHNHSINKDINSHDEPSTGLNTNNTDETNQLLISNRKIIFQNSINNNFENNNNNNQRKIPTIITTSNSGSCLDYDKQRLSITRYNDQDDDDDDSLNSSFFHDEQIIL